MIERLVSLGIKQFFGGARRGQPLLTAFGAAISIWSLFRRFNRKDKPVYTRKLKDGETVNISLLRGVAAVEEEEQ
ncbi:MAG: hypothetical protein QNL12_12740 [Acidimicrobiia bacterium]|nr:hypothetical protein [Acidimicrobiia bacterium]MDX2468177.1 hypothetical protein [Acidimicrobiia bacterium]